MKPRKQLGNKNCIGRRVTALREERGMKQKELLALLQVSGIDMGASTLSDLEGQNRGVSDRELRALARIFDVPLEELYDKENAPE